MIALVEADREDLQRVVDLRLRIDFLDDLQRPQELADVQAVRHGPPQPPHVLLQLPAGHPHVWRRHQPLKLLLSDAAPRPHRHVSGVLDLVRPERDHLRNDGAVDAMERAGRKTQMYTSQGPVGPCRDALDGKGPERRPQQRLDRRLKEVAKAVGGGYFRLQMPLSLALAIRGTVAGHRLEAGRRGEGGRGSRGGREGVHPPPPAGMNHINQELHIDPFSIYICHNV